MTLDKLSPTPTPPTSPSSRRARIATAAVLAIMLIGLGWLVEINAMLGQVKSFTRRMRESRCAYLNHRDPGFVRDETKKLCISYDELLFRLREIVSTAADIFEAHNLTYFLESGTLLGSYREKGIIRRDPDVDLGIDAATLLYLQTTNITVPDGYHLTVWNSSLYPDSGRDDGIPARLIHKETALYTDMFAFLDWKNASTGQDEVGPVPSSCFNGCEKCPKVGNGRHFKVPREWVYPLVDCPLDGRTFKCPREPAKYLEHMYGESYMTPTRRRH